MAPPLPQRAISDLASQLQPSLVKDRFTASLAARVSSYDPAALLMAITSGAAGEQDHRNILGNLRDVFAALSAPEVQKIVTEVSAKILSRAPTGQYWGTSSATRGLTGQALTRYQLVHRLVEDKLDSHKRLIAALNDTGVLTYEVVAHAALVDHQQLLLSAGLSAAVQESQQRLTNSTAKQHTAHDVSPQRTNFLTAGLLPDRSQPRSGNVDASQQFVETMHKESLRVVANGMDIAVRRVRGVSLEDIDSQGLSIVDQFYSEVCALIWKS